jgi:hypothetical protein
MQYLYSPFQLKCCRIYDSRWSSPESPAGKCPADVTPDVGRRMAQEGCGSARDTVAIVNLVRDVNGEHLGTVIVIIISLKFRVISIILRHNGKPFSESCYPYMVNCVIHRKSHLNIPSPWNLFSYTFLKMLLWLQLTCIRDFTQICKKKKIKKKTNKNKNKKYVRTGWFQLFCKIKA